MKKRISVLICTLLMILSLTGCGNEKAPLEYDQASIEQVTEFLIGYCMSTDEAAIEEWKSMSDMEMELQLINAGLPLTAESFIGAMDSWQGGIEECGAYIQHGEYVYEILVFTHPEPPVSEHVPVTVLLPLVQVVLPPEVLQVGSCKSILTV